MELITKLDRSLAKAEEIIMALMLVGMVLLAAAEVLSRNIWHTGFAWALETLLNTTLFLGMLGAAVATSEGRHLNIDLFSRVLSGRSKYLLKVVIGLFGLVVCSLLALGGWQCFELAYDAVVKEAAGFGGTAFSAFTQSFSDGNIPEWVSQIGLCGGFSLIAFHFLLRLIRDLSTVITGEVWDAVEQDGLEGDAVLDEMEAQMEDGKGGAS